MIYSRLEQTVKEHEGYRPYPYKDHRGFWTIGFGHLLHYDEIKQYEPHRTLGSLFEYLCDPATHERWLRSDLAVAERAARGYAAGHFDFDALSDVRQEVLTEMAFQMGGAGLNEFVDTRRAISRGHWASAAAEIVDSDLASPEQTPERAADYYKRMLTG